MLDTTIEVSDGNQTVIVDTAKLNSPSDFYEFTNSLPKDFKGTLPENIFNTEVTTKYGSLTDEQRSVLNFTVALHSVVKDMAETIAPLAKYNADYIITAFKGDGKAALPAIDPFDYEVYNKIQLLYQYIVMHSTITVNLTTGYDVNIVGYDNNDVYVSKDLRDSFRLAREPVHLTQ